MSIHRVITPTPLAGVQRDYDFSSLWFTREGHYRPVHSKQSLKMLIADTTPSLTLTVVRHPREGLYAQLTGAEDGGWYVEVASPYMDTHQVVRGAAPSARGLARMPRVAVSACRKAGGQALAFSAPEFCLGLEETVAAVGAWLAVQQPPTDNHGSVPYARADQRLEDDWPPDKWWM